MALVRINEKTVIQKVKFFVLGKEKPNWMTRISVLVGFFISLYFLIWQGFIFLVILFVNQFEDPELIKSTFSRIGGQYNFNIRYAAYDWTAVDVIFYHALGSIILISISIVGLIIIYRRKNLGYITYLSGNVLTALFTIIFLGAKYTSEQISIVDKIILIVITLYFFAGMFLLKRTKAKAENPIQTQS